MFTHSHINNDTKLHKNIILARKGSCFVIDKYFIFKNLYIRFNLIKFYSIFFKSRGIKASSRGVLPKTVNVDDYQLH